MNSALWYLLATSWRNRLVARIKRLKQPKYLVGAIVGGLYFYFYFFRWLFRAPGRGNLSTGAFGEMDSLLLEGFGALALAGFMVAAWFFPSKRAALTFTEAEVAFLFPAPISRRSLIHFKLLRSQFAILFTVFFLSLFSARSGSWMRTAIHAGGWWLLLSTLNLHYLGASLERTRLLDCGLTNARRRLLVLGLLLGAAGLVLLWARRTLPPFSASDLSSLAKITGYAESLLGSGPLPWLLAPFRLLVRPYMATDYTGFLVALAPAVLVLLLHYVWVVRSNVAFEEASLEASQKLAERVAAVRAGNWQSTKQKQKPARAPFSLKPAGTPVIALLWKNLIGAGSILSTRFVLVVLAVGFGVSLGFRSGSGPSGWPLAIAGIAAALAAWSLFFGPQVLRQDFRRELAQMDMLKGLPMPGWQIALGQILAPTLLLAVTQWLLVMVAIACGLQADRTQLPPSLLLGLGVSAMLVMPCLDLVSLIIPNAVVLLFPAWFQAGKDAPHGIEATGQRLIFALGQLLALIFAVVPAAGVFAIVFVVGRLLLPVWIALLISSVAAAVGLLITAGFGVFLLGRLFERFDLSQESST